MKEKKKQQPTTSKKPTHNTLDWVEKELRDVIAFDMGLSIIYEDKKWYVRPSIEKLFLYQNQGIVLITLTIKTILMCNIVFDITS